MNRGNCELKCAVASGHNKLWWPPTEKFSQFVLENYYVMCEKFPNNITKYSVLIKVYFNNFCNAVDNIFLLFRNFVKKYIYLYVFFVYLVLYA